MLSLPDTLVLFALHDDKGTVHPSAFLALDHGLRGAVLGELRLRGRVRTWRDGTLEISPGDAADPLLDRALEILHAAVGDRGTVIDGLTALTAGLPTLRRWVIRRLEAADILVSADTERVLLPGSTTHPMTDGRLEAEALDSLLRAIDDGDAIQPRPGTLLALVEACHLIDVILPADAQDPARELAAWVRQRDAIAAAVQEAAERIEGLWE